MENCRAEGSRIIKEGSSGDAAAAQLLDCWPILIEGVCDLGLGIEHNLERANCQKGLDEQWHCIAVRGVLNSPRVDGKDIAILRRNDSLGQRLVVLFPLVDEGSSEAQENLLIGPLSEFAVDKLRDLITTITWLRSNSLKPNTDSSNVGAEIGTFIAGVFEIEATLKQSNSEIHLPESLKEVAASILTEVTIGKLVKPTV